MLTMRISVVVPVYNESENIQPLVEGLAKLKPDLQDLEIVLVDDGSSDDTWQQIETCISGDADFRLLRIPENRGQSNAMLQGMHSADGDVIVFMDGDLQNDPSDIPLLVGKLQDCDVACGYRANRKDTWSRRMASRIGNTIRNWVTRDGIRDTGCSLKAFKRECRDDIPPLDGAHRFLAAYFTLHGRRIKEVPVKHHARRYGQSKYTNLGRLPRTLADLFGFCWYRKRLLRQDEKSRKG
jgi:dolichol-phosphate mannosyltransferase